MVELPAGRPVWLFGRENTHLTAVSDGIRVYGAEIGTASLRLGHDSISCQDKSVVVVSRHPGDPASVIALLCTDQPSAIQGLARKLPHYGKYSYLVFEGSEPSIIAKGQWETLDSPLNARLPTDMPASATTSAILPVRQPLATLPPLFSEERMMSAVRFLASEKRAGRGLGTPGLEEAGRYIEEGFKKAGLTPGSDDGTFFQSWEDVADATGRHAMLRNVIGCLPGTDEKLRDQSVIICAHYDHLGLGWPDVRAGNQGKIHPGADDNGSGVAVMLELARILSGGFKPARTIIFAAFTGEENGLMGSRRYVMDMKKFPAR
ncbi:MAG: M20/M25/M40 family metallo-hydrolase, partial [Candidatus Riflebacteria bacterium]|nr:M20/M25/M40 family metallo-hydrolase [Candidatus Riflebacteria bacterium]